MLGNGRCDRPVELRLPSEVNLRNLRLPPHRIEFLPTVTRQREQARERGQADRAELSDKIIGGIDVPPA